MEGEAPIALLLPQGLAPEGCVAVLHRALYGTRRASYLWGEKISTDLTGSDGGFKRTVGCGQFYVHEAKGLKVAVHGDDFLSTGPSDSLRWFDGFIRKAFKVKYGVRLGPGQTLEGGFLGRTLRFHPGWGLSLIHI